MSFQRQQPCLIAKVQNSAPFLPLGLEGQFLTEFKPFSLVFSACEAWEKSSQGVELALIKGWESAY
jgi:hypothetical protein